MVVNIAEGTLKTKYGTYREYLYYNGQKETIALVMGEVRGRESVLCRVHSACIAAHVFNSIECDCREQMERSQQLIRDAGAGIVIWLDQEGKANGHFALLKSKVFKSEGMPQAEAYEAAGFKRDARDFSAAAGILRDLGVRSIIMLTDNPGKTRDLEQFGIRVDGTKNLSG